MKLSSLWLISALVLLCACTSSHRPTYSGVEESTEGVPGFVNGKKVSPHVKLGQSYTVDGETYVPRHQPNYVEEGKASWYGPGFHGGKTANGEEFDASDLTAAHRTLPLPSIVRVTMLSNGKQVYVRVNDRGPFAHSRIIDLSRAAAEKIGLLRAGVAKVRVEYMENESERFAELLAQGRDPKSIDIASEVLNFNDQENAPTNYARSDVRLEDNNTQTSDPSITNQSAPVLSISSDDLAAPTAKQAPSAKPEPKTNLAAQKKPLISNNERTIVTMDQGDPNEDNFSPFAVIDAPSTPPATEKMEMASLSPAAPSTQPAATASSNAYVQFGAFQNEANAERIRKQFSTLGELKIQKKHNSAGQILYHVRMGPYTDINASATALEKAMQAGAEVRIIRE